MADGKDGGVAEYGLTDDDTNVDADLADAATGYAHLLDEAVVLIHQQEPELFHILILQNWVHVVVDAGGRT